MTQSMPLTNHLLIAMPSLRHLAFSKTVIYVCEQCPEETVGIIINKPMNAMVNVVYEQLGLKAPQPSDHQWPLLFGGPMQTERGFVLHRPCGHWRSSLSLVDPQVTITTSNDIIRAMSKNQGPKEALLALGYVAWDEKQLEQEIMDNVWLVCPFKSELLYDVPFMERWHAAGSLLGVNMDQLVSSIGHAG